MIWISFVVATVALIRCAMLERQKADLLAKLARLRSMNAFLHGYRKSFEIDEAGTP